MAERFTRVFELPGGFYAHGSPVLIRAGALLKDNISRNILCQLKFYNLEPVTIRSLTVYLQLQNTAGRNLGKEIRREYLDLRAGKDQSFGQNIALLLPYRNARRFTARVSEVVFADGTLWQDKGSAWHSTAKQPTLREQYGDEEVAAQFRVRYGVDCRYAPTVDGELWYCTCGTVNFKDEHSRHACKRVRRAQLGVSEEALRQAASGRRVALVCSGDPGVYGMAGLVLELAQQYPQVQVEIVSGVTAACGGAALLGAPLMHDWCCISLSDLMTPWEHIEARLRAAAQCGLCICLYNPGSRGRTGHLRQACGILLESCDPQTICGIVRNVGRPAQSSQTLTLDELRNTKVDMSCCVFVGNEHTRLVGGRMVTPRGYAREEA